MGVQIIFVVETNKNCKSDWMYIKDTINRFYDYDKAHVKLSTVYMGGRTKYERKEAEVKALINKYSKAAHNNKSIVIYCFDCDEYDKNYDDQCFLESVQQFCEKHDYKCVWFCKDIERVYLGRKVSDKQKQQEAKAFKSKKLINDIDLDRLSETHYRDNTSNILTILDKFVPQFKRRKQHTEELTDEQGE